MGEATSDQGHDEVAEPEGVRGPAHWLERPIVWTLAVGVVAIVLIEGFALSWGTASSTVPSGTTPHHPTNIARPSFQLCPKTKVQVIEVDYLRYPAGDERAKVTGHVVTVHCGGFDDLQFIVHATPVTVTLKSGARIVLMRLKLSPAFYVGNLKELNEYLSHDVDGNLFVVKGPDSEATALTAVFHP